jgi:biotin-(acetyl-CoA carboxylase) ligase
MAINTQDGRVQGTFHSIDEEGALLLRESSGTVRRFHFGDVVVGGDATAQNNAE